MGRRTLLAALLILTVVTVSGCGGLLGGGSTEDKLSELLKANAKAQGSSMPASVECEESDAIDYVESLDKAHTCRVTWQDGSSTVFCVMEDGSKLASAPDACEALAASGWGRS